MTKKDTHEHYFTYFLKEGKSGKLSAQVRELPGIFAQGETEAEINAVLPKVTQEYLQTFQQIHKQISNDTAKVLINPGFGKLVNIGSFVCKC